MNDAQETNPRIEFVVGIIIALVGAFFLVSAEDIPADSGDAFGPRSLPQAISSLIIALGTLWAAVSLRKARLSRVTSNESLNTRNRFLVARILPLMALSISYGFLFQWFGYLVSTFLILIPVLLIYGNRSLPRVLTVAVIATAVYFILFIKVMGVFDAGGSVVNFNELLGL
jgi:putative tricarboxylic transport membrane protein